MATFRVLVPNATKFSNVMKEGVTGVRTLKDA